MSIKPLLSKVLGKRDFRNFSWVFIDKALKMGGSLIFTVVLTRRISVELFGYYNLALSYYLILLPFFSLGIDGIAIREFVSKRSELKEILGTVFWVKFIGGMIALALFFTGWFVFNETYPLILYQLTFLFLLNQLVLSVDAIDLANQAYADNSLTIIPKSIAYIFGIVLKVSLVLLGFDLVIVVAISLLESFLYMYLVNRSFKIKHDVHFFGKLDYPRMKSFLKEGKAYFFSGLAIIFYMKMDQVMLSRLSTVESVAIYSAGTRVVDILTIFPTIFNVLTTPKLLSSFHVDTEKFHKCLSATFFVGVGYSFVCIILLQVFAPLIIRILYGNAYEDAINLLRFHSLTLVFICLGISTGTFIVAEKLSFISFYQTFLGAFINLILNIFLIPDYGYYGASVATVIAFIVSTFAFNMFYPKTRILNRLYVRAIKDVFCFRIRENIKNLDIS